MDRQAFRWFGAFALLYLPMSFYSPVFLICLLWLVALATLHFLHIGIQRRGQYAYWLEGRFHQIKDDMIEYRRVMYENAELKFKYDRLNTDYKKLESDYNQLKTKENK